MARNIGEQIVRGFEAGQKAREKWDERKAGEAMGELAAYDPMQQAQASAPAPQQGGYRPGGMDAGMPGKPQGQAQGEGGEQPERLPNTRDWVVLRSEALKKVARLGPDAVKEAMDEIDRIQDKGTLDNLYQARELIQQGNQEAAGKYLEAANSYQGNFTEVKTSPAKMRDGSTQLAFEVDDEHTGYPRMPGMIATLDVVDRLIMMAENPGKYGQTRYDRQMAEEAAGFERSKYTAGQREKSFRRRFDVEKERTRRSDKHRVKPKDFAEAATRIIGAYEDKLSGAALPPNQQVEIRRRVAEASRKPELQQYSPDEIAAYVAGKVLEGTGVTP